MQNSSSELILANFYIKLTNNLPIDDYLLKSFIQECVFGDTEEEKFFYFLTQLVQRQVLELKYKETFDYFYDIIKRTADIFNYNFSENDIKIITICVVSSQMSKLQVDYFFDENFVKDVEWVIADEDQYSIIENDILFFSWYVSNLKLLRIAIKDFNNNSKYIIVLADNSNNYAERERSIDFKGKGAILS